MRWFNIKSHQKENIGVEQSDQKEQGGLTKDVLAVLGLAVVVAVFYWQVVFLGKIFYWGDISLYFLPMYHTLADGVKDGLLQFWNPTISMGQALAGNPQAWLFYPTLFLLKWMTPEHYLTWSVVVHIFISGLGMYVYLRRTGFSVLSCWFGAAVFMLCGAVTARGQFPNMVMAASWWAWSLWAVDRLIERPSFGRSCTLAAFWLLSIFSAHPQTSYMMFLATTAYLGWRFWQTAKRDRPRLWRALGWFSITAFASIIGAFAYLLSTLEIAMQSHREYLTYSRANRFLLFPEQMFNAVMPQLFGAPFTGNFYGRGNYWESFCYLGLVPLAFSAFAVFRLPSYDKLSSWRWLWVWVAAISLWLSLGRYGGLYFYAFKWLPGLRSFHDPARWLMLWSFAICCLSVVGLERWIALREVNIKALIKASKQTLYFAIALMFLALVWWVIGLNSPKTVKAVVNYTIVTWHHLEYPFLSDTNRAQSVWHSSLKGMLFPAVWIVVIAILMYISAVRKNINNITVCIAAIVLLLIDVIPTNSSLLPVCNYDELIKYRTEAVNRNEPYYGDGRIFANDPWGGFAWRRHVSYVTYDNPSEHIEGLMNSLTQNTLAIEGKNQADGYEPIGLLRPYILYLTINESIRKNDDRANNLLRSAGVSSIVRLGQDWNAWIEPVNEKSQRAYVPEQVIAAKNELMAMNILSSTFINPNKSAVIEGIQKNTECVGTCKIIIDTPDRVVIKAIAETDCWVILRDSAASGWKAWLDDKPVKWKNANVAFRAVRTPPGIHIIEFKYQPASVVFGMYCLFLSAGLIAASIFYKWTDMLIKFCVKRFN